MAFSLLQAGPHLQVDLASFEGIPAAHITLHDLLTDRRFLAAVRSGFPLYLEYLVQLREYRANWFDRTVSEHTWEYVTLYDPVRETFIIEDAEVREDVGSEEDLSARLRRVWIVPLAPDEFGTFYYQARVEARTLSDDDVDEVFDWLRGEQRDTAPRERRGIVTRAARRMLVRIASLPSLTVNGQSARFDWTPDSP